MRDLRIAGSKGLLKALPGIFDFRALEVMHGGKEVLFCGSGSTLLMYCCDLGVFCSFICIEAMRILASS